MPLGQKTTENNVQYVNMAMLLTLAQHVKHRVQLATFSKPYKPNGQQQQFQKLHA